MAYTKHVWKNRSVQKPRTYTKVDNVDGTITLTPSEGTIYEAGTPVTETWMNEIEQGIADAGGVVDKYYIPTSTTSGSGASSKTVYSVTTGKVTSYTDNMRFLIKPTTTASIAYATDVSATNYIPTMTANTTGQFIANGGGRNGTNEYYLAFDKSTSSCWESSVVNTGNLTITLDKPIKVQTYTINVLSVGVTNPKTWTLQGSNDGGTSWFTVDTVSNYTFSTANDTFTTDTQTTAYQMYKLNITATSSATYNPKVYELQFATVLVPTTSYSTLATINVDSLGEKTIAGVELKGNKTYELRYDSTSNSFIASTLEEKQVGRTFVLDQPATSFTISGLDINNDGGFYEIQFNNVSISTASGSIYMYINGDTTNANYISGNPNVAPTSSYPQVFFINSTNTFTGNILLQTTNTTVCATATGYNKTGTSYIQLWSKSTNTGTNINSITFNIPSGTINTATVKIIKR